MPAVKSAAQESSLKLTHRQLRVADLLKGNRTLEPNKSGYVSPMGIGRQLIADNSILNLNSNMGQYSNANLRSQDNLVKNQSESPKQSMTESKPRKVFGAADYLER